MATAVEEKKIASETHENPKMLQVFSEHAYHEVFCYGLAVERNPNKREYDTDKLLMAVISGSDSAIQSIKAAIDIGSHGLSFGYGTKSLSSYEFTRELLIRAEKGKYDKIPMSINRNRKALAVIHEEIANNSKYVLSFDGQPEQEIANLLGGAQYGLTILDEWKDVVFHELLRLGYLVKHEVYADQELFPSLEMYSIDLSEEQADLFISDLIKQGKLKFPVAGNGSKAAEINNLTEYLMNYTGELVKKVSSVAIPFHDPLHEPYLPHFDTYKRELFPVQAHVATAISKRLLTKKSVILQGEMSSGKSAMMTAVADGYSKLKNLQGYFAILICPPSLTNKWPKEIKMLIPKAEVIVVKQTADLIRYHSEWVRNGRKKPTKPVYFVISFTTLRNDAAIRPAVNYARKRTPLQIEKQSTPYRDGYYCPGCGKPHQTIDSMETMLEDNTEKKEYQTHNMTEEEFGSSRRLHNTGNPANAFCFYCGESLWTRKVRRRYQNFAEWASRVEKPLLNAISSNDAYAKSLILSNQPDYPTSTSMPRRIAAIEYIRRKMKGDIDICIVDEIHELKGGMTAQGNALGSLAAVSNKVIAGTGTLFGGKAEDIYYLMFRLNPKDMVDAGFEYQEVTKFNEEYGNIEETTYERKEKAEYSNSNSRGGQRTSRKKVVPGISSFVFGKFLLHNVVNVRLKDVWPDPVELVDTPTIFVDMTEEQKNYYQQMIAVFEREINSRDDGFKLYTQMLDYGIAYPDNPFQFPNAYFKTNKAHRELIWEAQHLDENCTLPKEEKLQEIVKSEMDEGRPCIVYVRDTGSSVSERDVRPRLKKKLEEIGAKVCILDTSTSETNKRSEWLENKIVHEGYDVCIVSQELVKVGLDLLCTPTIIYYQFSWSLFTINQSSRRAWRIGQTEECRLYYLAYKDCYQQYMADIIARKNKAAMAINGDASSEGLNAMLGDDGDLQTLLIESVKNGNIETQGSAEEWIQSTSDRAREILANIGKPKVKRDRPKDSPVVDNKEQDLFNQQQFDVHPIGDARDNTQDQTAQMIKLFKEMDDLMNIVTAAELRDKSEQKGKSKNKKSKVSDNQLSFDLFEAL